MLLAIVLAICACAAQAAGQPHASDARTAEEVSAARIAWNSLRHALANNDATALRAVLASDSEIWDLDASGARLRASGPAAVAALLDSDTGADAAYIGVRQAMRRLDDRCRKLLTLLFLEPATPSYESVASRLGIPIGSVGPTRARCFKKMDAVLREMGIEPATARRHFQRRFDMSFSQYARARRLGHERQHRRHLLHAEAL